MSDDDGDGGAGEGDGEGGPDLPLPDAPGHLSEREQRAYRAGARDGGAAMLRLIGSEAMTLAGAIEDGQATGGDADGPPAPDASDDDGPGECPDCGADLVLAFGGAECLACGYPDAAE